MDTIEPDEGLQKTLPPESVFLYHYYLDCCGLQYMLM